MSLDLFPGQGGEGEGAPRADAPLAERLRPRRVEEVVGQEHLTAPDALLGRLVAGGDLPSLILWGPPGSGKTTLARVLARGSGARFLATSAVAAGVREVREAVRTAQAERKGNRRTVLFLDEIHRFNRAQQDALLPHVETGLLVLIGATTENPSFEVNSALLSRCRVVTLRPLPEAALRTLLRRALDDRERGLGEREVSLDPEAENLLLWGADGDARRLLGTLELAVNLAGAQKGIHLDPESIRQALQRRAPRYDRTGEEHFNLISALQKSVRASDPQGAVYWTVRMLDAGEDPLYVARRLLRMAVEDVGLADPRALEHTVAAQQAVHFLGLPEGAAALVQAAVYLALAPKSNRVDTAERQARAEIERSGSLPVPLAFRNAVTGLMRTLGYGEGYRYDHDEPGALSGQSGLPPGLDASTFYEPSPRGYEAELRRRMEEIARHRPPTKKKPGPSGGPGS